MYQKANCDLIDLMKIIFSSERCILNALNSGLRGTKISRSAISERDFSEKFFSMKNFKRCTQTVSENVRVCWQMVVVWCVEGEGALEKDILKA